MATYKVLQDIEAEDKLLGPLSLKQFIFAAITIGLGTAMFFIGASPAPTFLKIPLILTLVFPMLLTGFLAAPISRDQPNEIWLLARISFLFRPRKRIWNQDGVKELVTVTAPKKEVHVYTNGLSQTEVKSRLQALANTVDSRGWAVKNVNTNLFAQPGYLGSETASDRLVDPMTLPQDVPVTDITASDDILDVTNNTTAAHLDQLVQNSTATHRQQAISAMNPDPKAQQTPNDYWFMNNAAPSPQTPMPADFSVFQSQQVVIPGTEDVHPAAEATPEETAFAKKAKAEHARTQSHITDHVRVVQPLHDKDGKRIVKKTEDTPEPALDPVDPFAMFATPNLNDTMAFLPPEPTVSLPQQATPTQPQSAPNPAILGLAHNDDFSVATIARQAKRISEDDGEVVISLH